MTNPGSDLTKTHKINPEILNFLSILRMIRKTDGKNLGFIDFFRIFRDKSGVFPNRKINLLLNKKSLNSKMIVVFFKYNVIGKKYR